MDGGFTTPDIAEKALKDGVCDYIGLGRPILADPDWAIKLSDNRPEDIRPCIRCTMGCVGPLEKFNAAVGLRCSVNPRCNMAGIREIAPITRKKRVCIVGGGPAGMEAAMLLTTRGHEVCLYEKRKLGGTMNEAAFDPSFKSDINNLIDYYKVQLNKLNVKVLEENATAEKILADNYDAVIIATGAPALPATAKGAKEHSDKVMKLYDYATNAATAELGDTVLIVGGCFMNLEVAYSLALKGKNVIVSSRRGLSRGIIDLGDDNSAPQQQRLSNLLMGMRDKIRLIYGHSITEITDRGAILTSLKNKNAIEVDCDNIIMCRGYHGQPEIYNDLLGKVELYLVGDATLRSRCDNKRVIGNAIEDAWGIANRI